MKKTEEDQTPISRWLWLTLLIVMLLIGAKVVMHTQGPEKHNAMEQGMPALGEVSDFRLLNDRDEVVTLDDLRGSVWVADFIFTRCAGPCPMMTNKLKMLQDSPNAENLKLISFTVDPDYDSPEILKAYAEKHGYDPERWNFLTGGKDDIYALAHQHFKLGVSSIPEGEREAADQTVRHSTRFVLVDQNAQIRGYYDSQMTGVIQNIVDDAKKLISLEEGII